MCLVYVGHVSVLSNAFSSLVVSALCFQCSHLQLFYKADMHNSCEYFL